MYNRFFLSGSFQPSRLCFVLDQLPEGVVSEEESEKNSSEILEHHLKRAENLMLHAMEAVVRKMPEISEKRIYDKALDREVSLSEKALEQVRERYKAYIKEDIGNISEIVVGAQPKQRQGVIQALNRHMANVIYEWTEGACESALNLLSSHTDSMTQLPNKQAFLERLKFEVERWVRNGPLSLLMIDLDHFKKVNDTYGHAVGDQVLTEAAARMRGVSKGGGAVRTPDFVGRYGGEEFVVIYPDTPPEGACVGAHRISKAISSKPFVVEGSDGKKMDLNISVSIGVAEYKNSGGDPLGKKMFSEADDNVYVVKGEKPDVEGNKISRRGSVSFMNKIISFDEAKDEFLKAFPDGWAHRKMKDPSKSGKAN